MQTPLGILKSPMQAALIAVFAICLPANGAPQSSGQEIGTLSKTKSQDSTSVAGSYAPLEGKLGPHPDFILPSIDGNESIQLSKFRGKKVLLLHFASW